MLMSMLSFLSLDLLQIDPQSQLFNLFTRNYMCKLLTKPLVTVVRVREQGNACEWNLVVNIQWSWGMAVFWGFPCFCWPCTWNSKLPESRHHHIICNDIWLHRPAQVSALQTADKCHDKSLFRWVVSLTDLFSYWTMIVKKYDAEGVSTLAHVI